MISMWSRPRKPQRKPKPSATEVSGSKTSEASLSLSFSSASRRSSYLAPSAGYIPAYTIGFTFLNPGSGAAQGRSAEVTVSPTRVSPTFFIDAVMYPTSPAERQSRFLRPNGSIIPTSTTSKVFLLDIIIILSPGRTRPSITRT